MTDRNIVKQHERVSCVKERKRAPRLRPDEVKKLLKQSEAAFDTDSHTINGRSYLAPRMIARGWCWLFSNGVSYQTIADTYGKSKESVNTLIHRHVDWMKAQIS